MTKSPEMTNRDRGDDPRGSVSEVIILIRRSLGLTQTEMAGRLRVSPVTVYRYEKSSQVPKADTLTLLLDLAKELG